MSAHLSFSLIGFFKILPIAFNLRIYALLFLCYFLLFHLNFIIAFVALEVVVRERFLPLQTCFCLAPGMRILQKFIIYEF